MRYSANGQKMIQWISIGVVFALLCILPVSAMSLSSTKYTGTIAAGETVTYPITIGLGTNENPVNFTLEVMGFGQNLENGYTPLDSGIDTNPYSARPYITLNKNQIRLNPGTSQKITATIALPKNVGSGGRYAIIYLYAVPSKGQVVTTAVNIPVFITISGTNPSMMGTITSVDVGEMTAGQPISVTTTLKNTGNYHYFRTANQVAIIDASGNRISNSSTVISPNVVIPGNTVQYIMKPDVKNLQPGSYTVNSKILLESGTVLDEKTAAFTVKTDYIPPTTESSITLTPGSAGTLTSPDGRYSISFPQGAVLGDAGVTLKPYSRDKLQAPPANAKLGTTSFEITGLTGLLSKDATVRVTYSTDDLAAAGGDASQLKLSYYDAAQNAWIILPTLVDTGSKTLTSTTNHLSVWTVMVSSSTTSSPVSGAAPKTKATQSPLPLPVIFVALMVILILPRTGSGKRK